MTTHIEATDYTKSDAPQHLHDQIKQNGFALLRNHPIPRALMSEVMDLWRTFFQSPNKANYIREDKQLTGFFPASISEIQLGQGEKDIKEFFHFTPDGDCPDSTRKKTETLYKLLEKLGLELLDWLDGKLPPHIKDKRDSPLHKMVAGANQLLRIAHYPPLSGDEPAGAMRSRPHVDSNMLTILLCTSASGLQVKNPKGSWLDIPGTTEDIIVNLGSQLEETTQNYYPGTLHRVVNPYSSEDNTNRYSIPFFIHARPEVRLSERYTSGEHRKEHYKLLYQSDLAAF